MLATELRLARTGPGSLGFAGRRGPTLSEIFISYARSTEREAEKIAEALRRLGYDIWRDDDLPAHRDYSEVIEERLRAAKAVVVVWSTDAVKSQWVRAEADVAREAGTLVQLSIDGAALPLPFNRIQCADLRGWRGDVASPGWRKVAESVQELVRGSPPAGERSLPARQAALSSAMPERLTIAVSPFADPVGVAAGDDFADGLVAEIATALARFPVLLVVQPGAGAARYVLEGSVRRSGPRVRINVQLSEIGAGERVWAERFDDALEDTFALQDDVASRVAVRVEAAILAHETRQIASRPPQSLTAHELYLRSRETIRRAGFEDVEEIEALSERAIALDDRHGRALGLLACALGFRIAYAGAGLEAAGLRARYIDAARRAMLVGADDPEVLAFVGEAHLLADGDMVAARALVDRALKMNPALAVAWDISANIRMQSGEYADALERYERCLYLDPQSPWRTYVWPSMAGCMVALGRLDEAIVLAKEGLQIAPDNPWASAYLIAALAHSGRIEEARAVLAQLDPRQAGVFARTHFGPKLTADINEALRLAGWTAT